jgi:predicted nucleic acid-binding protein
MKLKIYIDTSVFSACFDERAPDRKLLTVEFWQSRNIYECSTSDLGLDELNQTTDLQLRAKMKSLLAGVNIIPVTREMENLAEKYISMGAFTGTMYNDAVHVAAATLSGQDVLVSWNFRHLVNRRRRAMVCDINGAAGLRAIEIMSPPEL